MGLEGGFGSLTFGRQENLVFNTAGQYDALSIGNLGATAWHVTATGVRIDNAPIAPQDLLGMIQKPA